MPDLWRLRIVRPAGSAGTSQLAHTGQAATWLLAGLHRACSHRSADGSLTGLYLKLFCRWQPGLLVRRLTCLLSLLAASCTGTGQAATWALAGLQGALAQCAVQGAAAFLPAAALQAATWTVRVLPVVARCLTWGTCAVCQGQENAASLSASAVQVAAGLVCARRVVSVLLARCSEQAA